MIFDWLEKLGSRPDHPMHGVAEARNLLADLPRDAFRAVEEITAWLSSVTDTEGFRLNDRVGVIKLLDETAQPYQRKLCRDYLTAARMQKFQESRLWAAIFEFWKHSAAAYLLCLEEYGRTVKGAESVKDELPLLAVRALRSLAAQKKWLHIRYRPIEERIWADLCKVYQFAEAKAFAHNLFPLYPESARNTSVQQELLKALMFEMSSPGSLSHTQMELVDRLVAHFAPSFNFEERPTPGSTFYFDLSLAAAPTRAYKGMQLHALLRFFGGGVAAAKLGGLVHSLEEGATPPELGFGEEYARDALLDMIEHLQLYWASKPPQRQHMRTRTMARFSVAHRFPEILRQIAADEKNAVADEAESRDLPHPVPLDMKLYGFVAEKTQRFMPEMGGGNAEAEKDETESWIMENVSAGGFGAVVPQLNGDWLKVGTLLGLKAEQGGRWMLGAVRRLGRDASERVSVGIQTLSRNPVPVRFRLLEQSELPRWREIAEAASGPYLTAVLLPHDAVKGEGPSLVVERNNLVAGRNCLMLVSGEAHLVRLASVLEQGEDYERVGFTHPD
ncbi:MAG: hypothetical protein AB1710_04095 [Pseudomonadota bacterium]